MHESWVWPQLNMSGVQLCSVDGVLACAVLIVQLGCTCLAG